VLLEGNGGMFDLVRVRRLMGMDQWDNVVNGWVLVVLGRDCLHVVQ